MKNTIVKNDASAKKNLHVRCCHCSSSLTIRNGTYPRNDPKNNTEIRVQRYLCKSPECPWQSFSVLPEPVLPVIRHAYETRFDYYAMFKKGMSQDSMNSPPEYHFHPLSSNSFKKRHPFFLLVRTQ